MAKESTGAKVRVLDSVKTERLPEFQGIKSSLADMQWSKIGLLSTEREWGSRMHTVLWSLLQEQDPAVEEICL